jgi:hypothetical protein
MMFMGQRLGLWHVGWNKSMCSKGGVHLSLEVAHSPREILVDIMIAVGGIYLHV